MAKAIHNNESSKESLLIYGGEDTFGIYQLKSGEELHYHRFESLDSLKEHGLSVDRNNYELVYTDSLAESDTLDSIYERFNNNHPADFKGHSLSVSDVAVFQRDGKTHEHYVDSFGFKELPSFLDYEKPNKEQESDIKDVIDTQISDISTVKELEEEVKKGIR